MKTPLETLRQRVADQSQKVVAKELGFSTSFICDILKGRKEMTEKLAAALGFTRKVVKWLP